MVSGARPNVGSDEDRTERREEMGARLDSSAVDEALLEELQSLSVEERQELARILFERNALLWVIALALVLPLWVEFRR